MGTSGAHRIAVTPWALALISTLLSLGCAAPTPVPAPDPIEANFRSANGLLFPPELWAAPGPSTESALLRELSLRVTGAPATWTESGDQTLAQVAAETSLPEAAFLVGQAGLTTSALSDHRLRAVARDAVDGRDLDALWMVSQTPSAPALRDVVVAARSWLLEEAGASDTVPRLQARDLLAQFVPGEAPPEEPSTDLVFRHARDAAYYLYRRSAEQEGWGPASDPRIVKLAQAAIGQDDWVRYWLVRAYAAAGEESRAVELARDIDPRRLLPGNVILEPPQFEGTLGSTFRMIRYLTLEERSTALNPSLRTQLVGAAEKLRATDLSHRLAGDAIIVLLAPGELERSEPSSAVAAAVRANVGDLKHPLASAEKAQAWMTIAEHAQAMGVPLAFPGLSASATRSYLRSKEDGVRAAARLLLAVSTTAGDSRSVRQLVALVSEHLRERPLASIDSAVLFAGSLAIHRLTGSWVVRPEALRAEIMTRSGGCRGGFDGFVRSSSQQLSACDVDASWIAASLNEELPA